MRVLITGVTGQDGSYLAEQEVAAGHKVYGMIRGHRNPRRQWIQDLVPDLRLVDGDLQDQSSLQHVIKEVEPEIIYNLGALTFVGMSWHQPTLMSDVTGLGVLRLLEAIRTVKPDVRLVQASSSEQFGSSTPPQWEETAFHPRSPYGVAKTFAHQSVVNYRESYNLHVSTAIMFNHTSVRRGFEFVERKVTRAVAEIKVGRRKALGLGNMNAARDWGWAPDYMKALPLIAARDAADDYCLATGESHTVWDLVQQAFEQVELDPFDYVKDDPAMHRPADVEYLLGRPWKAQSLLKWDPGLTFNDIVHSLMKHDLKEVSKE